MAWLMADVGLAEVIHLIVRALAMALTFVVARFVYRGVKVRLRFRRMARQGIVSLIPSALRHRGMSARVRSAMTSILVKR